LFYLKFRPSEKDGEEELVVIGGQGVTLTSGADHIAPQPPFP
jgi:hypothetical protein